MNPAPFTPLMCACSPSRGGRPPRCAARSAAPPSLRAPPWTVPRSGWFGTYDEAAHLYAITHRRGLHIAEWLYDKHGTVCGARKVAAQIAASYRSPGARLDSESWTYGYSLGCPEGGRTAFATHCIIDSSGQCEG